MDIIGEFGVQAIHLIHPVIGDNQVYLFLIQPFERSLGIGHGYDAQIHGDGFHHGSMDRQDHGLIINDEHGLAIGRGTAYIADGHMTDGLE